MADAEGPVAPAQATAAQAPAAARDSGTPTNIELDKASSSEQQPDIQDNSETSKDTSQYVNINGKMPPPDPPSTLQPNISTSATPNPTKEVEPEMDLAPLPTEFDPNAPPPLPQPTSEDQSNSNPFGVREEEDDLNSISEHGQDIPEEEDEGKMMEYITSLQHFGAPEEEEEEEEVEQIEDKEANYVGVKDIVMEDGEGEGEKEHQPKDGEEVLKEVDEDTQHNEKEKEGTKEVEAEIPSRRSSPLTPVSDIPDLPADLNLSPIAHTTPSLPEPTTSTSKPKPKETSPKNLSEVENNSIPHAESSSSARKRASPSTTPVPTRLPITAKMPLKAGTKRKLSDKPRGRAESKGKGKEREDVIVIDDDEVDELDSIEDEDELSEVVVVDQEKDKEDGSDLNTEEEVNGGKRQNKRAKSNGRLIKASKSASGKKKHMDPPGLKPLDKPPEKVTPRGKAFSDAMIKKLLKGKTKEVQLAACQRPRYGKWGKCTQCIAKLGGDSCRFRDFRTFPIDPETSEITGPGYFESTEWKDAVTPLPTEFNIEFEEEHIVKTEKTVAPMLLPLITAEARHVFGQKAIKRGMDAAIHRSVCDFCSSTIFGGWFVCKTCGRDYCLQCERYFPDSLETMMISPWPLPDAARPRLLKCQHVGAEKQSRTPAFHYRERLQPVSRFDGAELKDHWMRLSGFVLDDGKETMDGKLGLMGLKKDDEEVKNILNARNTDGKEEGSSDEPLPLPNDEIGVDADELEEIQDKFRYTKSTHPSAEPIPDPAELESHSREFIFLKDEDLTNDIFDKVWSRGEPIVVDGVDRKLNLGWGPDDFIERFGAEQCYVVNCQTNVPKLTTVGKFFDKFKNTEGRSKDILKLKDWPATDDFKNTHPELYHDFCDALPVPDYTRREGVMNLYSHFPPGPTRPDIGPKMYNAFEARETKGGFGSTRLHMDVADAVNLLLYASPRSKRKHDSSSNRADQDQGKDKDQGKDQDQVKDQDQGKDKDHIQAGNENQNQAQNNETEKEKTPLDQSQVGNEDGDKDKTADNLPSTSSIQDENQDKDKTTDNPPPTTSIQDENQDPNIQPEAAAAEAESDPQPGCAVWDLFRAEDAGLIRDFLTEKFRGSHTFTDPIHSQLFYLDAALRRELFESKGVRGWRIYQYPGQAVFIPAGCAHQVCNLADCIKIALDFVSPHNVKRCQQLTQDFRKENFAKAWKEDVLQLYNVLWYAWLSCIETRKRRQRESEEAAVAQKAREAHLASLRKGQHESWDGGHHHSMRIGSPLSSASNQGWGGGWNVSSVRDEPQLDSRSPSLSRGGSPTIARIMSEDVKGGEKGTEKDKTNGDAEKKDKEGEEDADVQKSKSQETLAEDLFQITIKKEPPSSSETFLGSNNLWSGKKGLITTRPPPNSTINNNNKPSSSPDTDDVKPLSARQQAILEKQKEQEKAKLERKLKNPPRELRTSTLIKLGARKLEDVLAEAQGEMLGEMEGGLMGGEEVWPNPNPNPAPASLPGAAIDEMEVPQNESHGGLLDGNDPDQMILDGSHEMEVDADIRDSLRTLHDVLRDQEEKERMEGLENLINDEEQEEQEQIENNDNDGSEGRMDIDVEGDDEEREELAANLRLVGEIEMDDEV